jgi:hypothetical protein
MSDNDEGAQVQVAPETKVVGKVKKTAAPANNLIATIAEEVEKLTKAKALALAETLTNEVETDTFRLGGILKVINDNSWFEGYESFDSFVFEKFGFQSRKARYLIQIYTELVDKQIPWEKVGPLGWTKIKDLAGAGVLTVDNVDEWVAKASALTVLELQAVLKGPSSDSQPKASTTDDVQTMKFKLKNDQVETVQSALNKAKVELGTDHDNVALENICAGYVAGVVGGGKTPDLKSLMLAAGWEAALNLYGEVFPSVNITVEAPAE